MSALEIYEDDRPDGPSAFRVVQTDRNGRTREALVENDPLRSAIAELYERRKLEADRARERVDMDEARLEDVHGWLLSQSELASSPTVRVSAREVRTALRGGPLLEKGFAWLREEMRGGSENARRARIAWRLLERAGKIVRGSRENPAG